MISHAELKARVEDLVAKFEKQVDQQEMSPRERAIKTWSFEEPDRLFGSFAVFSPLSLGVTEITTHDYYTDPWAFYYIQALSVVEWGNELPLMYGDPYHVEFEAMGGKLKFPEGSNPMIVEPLLKNKSDLSKLKIPDPERDGRMPMHLELCRMHKEYLGNMTCASVSCNGPFSLAVILRGYGEILRDIRKDPLFVHELLDFCCRVLVRYGKALVESHNSSPTIQTAWECLPHVSPEIFYEYCLPYIARCVEALRNPNTGLAGMIFHGYGTSLAPNWKSFLRTVCATGIAALPLMEEDINGLQGYGKLDVAEYKAICSSMGVSITSFINPKTMIDGPVERIRQLVNEWFKAAGSGGGYSASASWEAGAPVEHLHAFVDAIHKCRYPVRE